MRVSLGGRARYRAALQGERRRSRQCKTIIPRSPSGPTGRGSSSAPSAGTTWPRRSPIGIGMPLRDRETAERLRDNHAARPVRAVASVAPMTATGRAVRGWGRDQGQPPLGRRHGGPAAGASGIQGGQGLRRDRPAGGGPGRRARAPGDHAGHFREPRGGDRGHGGRTPGRPGSPAEGAGLGRARPGAPASATPSRPLWPSGTISAPNPPPPSRSSTGSPTRWWQPDLLVDPDDQPRMGKGVAYSSSK